MGDDEPQKNDISILYPGIPPAPVDRQVRVFKAPSRDGPVSNRIELPDSFYNLSAADLKLAQESLSRKVENFSQPGFKTSSQRDKERKEKEARYPKTVIRVRFPDRIQIQFTFLTSERVSSLYIMVKSSLVSPERSFNLYTTPPKVILKDHNLNFYQARLTPSSVVYFTWADVGGATTTSFILPHLIDIMEDLPIPPDPSLASDASTSNNTHPTEEKDGKGSSIKGGKGKGTKDDKAGRIAKLMGFKK